MSTVDRSLKTLAKGSGLVLAGVFASKLFGYLYRIIVARIGVEDYGLLNLGLAITGLFIILSTFGLDWASTRFIPEFLEKKNYPRLRSFLSSVYQMSSLFGLLAFALVFFSADWIAVTLFHNAKLALFLRVLAFSIPFATWRNISVAVLKGHKDVTCDVYSRNIAENVFKVLFTVGFLVGGYGIFGATLSYTLAMFASLLVALLFLRKVPVRFFSSLYKRFAFRKDLLIYSWPLLFNSFLIVVISLVDSLMIGGFLHATEVGIYNAAMPLAMLMSVFPKSLMALFLPTLVTSYVQRKKDYQEVYHAVTKWILMVNLFLFAVLALFAGDILAVLFGVDYVPGSMALVILSVGFLVQSFAVFGPRELLMLKHKTQLIFRITAFSVCLDVLLNYLLIPRFGIQGAAVATASSFVVMGLLMAFFSWREHGVPPLRGALLRVILALVLAVAVLFVLPQVVFNSALLTVLVSIFVLGVLYLVALFLTRCFEQADLSIVEAILRRIGLKGTGILQFFERFI